MDESLLQEEGVCRIK